MVTSVATVAGKVLRKENIGSRNERAISLHLFDSMFLTEFFAPLSLVQIRAIRVQMQTAYTNFTNLHEGPGSECDGVCRPPRPPG